MRALTEIEEAGQYTPGNMLYRQTRKTGRYDDGTTDHDQQGSAVTLAGNVYRERNVELQKQLRDVQAEYLAEEADDRFAPTRPKLWEDAKFREL